MMVEASFWRFRGGSHAGDRVRKGALLQTKDIDKLMEGDRGKQPMQLWVEMLMRLRCPLQRSEYIWEQAKGFGPSRDPCLARLLI